MFRRVAVVALAAILTLALSAIPGVAEKGGNGGGVGKGNNKTYATLSVTPDPVAAYGGSYLVEGSGFTPNAIIYVQESRPYCCTSFNVMSDDSGRVLFSRPTGGPGTYTVEAFEKKRRRVVLVAETTFVVED